MCFDCKFAAKRHAAQLARMESAVAQKVQAFMQAVETTTVKKYQKTIDDYQAKNFQLAKEVEAVSTGDIDADDRNVHDVSDAAGRRAVGCTKEVAVVE